MGTSVKELQDFTTTIFKREWDVRKGTVVPETDDLTLLNEAVELDASFLYADLAGSSIIAEKCPWETTAKILRAYLECATRLIVAYGGKIRSFDGDRVMGVFVGSDHATNATRCAREIFYMVDKILGPLATDYFTSIRDNKIQIRHSVGIDSGTARAVRAGIRNNNDIIWIGQPPSLAAKLSDIRSFPYCLHVSSQTFRLLGDSEKMDGTTHMWEWIKVQYAGKEITVYRTKYVRTP